MRRLTGFLIFGLGAFLGSIMTGEPGKAAPTSRVKDEVLQRCAEDGAGWWREPMSALKAVILLGDVEDPATTGGMQLPKLGYAHLGGGLEVWLEQTPLRSVDLYIDPSIAVGNGWLLGPKIGERAGVYRFEVLKVGDLRCAAYSEANRLRRDSRPSTRPILKDVGACVGFRYVGDFDRKAYDHIEFSYLDQAALRHGYRRYVNVVIRTADDAVVARGVHYAVPGQPPICVQDKYYITDILGGGEH